MAGYTTWRPKHSPAKIIEVLDKYLGLTVDYKPLIARAQEFEEKLRGLMSKVSEVKQDIEKKKLSYMG